MPKKEPQEQDEDPKIIRTSTTYLLAEGDLAVTVTVSQDDGEKENEPVAISVEPMPDTLSQWLEVAAFLQDLAAELTGDANQS